jgi:curved DNA-binding protein CbpA
MADRDPYLVLGLSRGATRAAVKAAWRRLAREHHPDTIGDDAAAKRQATRRMAEINRAYEALTASPLSGDGAAATRRRPNGPPPPPPSRPVTGRLDTTATFRPRNTTTTPPEHRYYPPPQPPPPRAPDREPPRASDPTGPLHRRRSSRRARPDPSLADASAMELAFGRFHGHTLGEVAAFEPSYIDWLARTVTRDPDLVAAARVVKADLDEREVVRRPRPSGRPEGHPFERSF